MPLSLGSVCVPRVWGISVPSASMCAWGTGAETEESLRVPEPGQAVPVCVPEIREELAVILLLGTQGLRLPCRGLRELWALR